MDNHGGIKHLLKNDFNLSELQKNIILINTDSGVIQIKITNTPEFTNEVALISVDSMTPEIVGKAWEILIGLFIQINECVWISTYSQQHLSQYGETRKVALDNVDGVLLSPKGFDKMIS
jgi:hypothetical protein